MSYVIMPNPTYSSCHFTLWTTSDIDKDSSNPTYSVKLPYGFSCRVTEPSTVYFVAIRSTIAMHDGFPPHCGLMLKNNFILTQKDGTEHRYQHMVIHSLYKDGWMWIHVFLCQTEEAVYQQLESVGPKGEYKSTRRGKRGGWTSALACSQFVTVMQAELNRKFSMESGDIYKGGKLDLSYSNCALCAARLFCAADLENHTNGELREIMKVFTEELQYESSDKWMQHLAPVVLGRG